MSASVFSLLNPTLLLLYAATFFGLWLSKRSRTFVALFAVHYLLVSFGFVLQYFTLPLIGEGMTRMASNAAFLLSLLVLSAAMGAHYHRAVPYASISLLLAGGYAAVAWFMFVEPNVMYRVLAMNVVLGGGSLIIATQLRALPAKRVIDRLLLGLFVVFGLNFIVRTITIFELGGAPTTTADLHQSLFWQVFTFSNAILTLMSAMAFLALVIIDMLNELSMETKTDPLSQLLNRRGFEEAADIAFARAAATGAPVALVVADLDKFKAINDTFGHDMGDRVIELFSGVMRRLIGSDNPVGRLGGEEFAFVLPGADRESAQAAADRVRIAFSRAPTPGRALGGSRRLTASFGVAQRHADENFSDVLARADRALYEAKDAGRDCVRGSDAVALPHLMAS